MVDGDYGNLDAAPEQQDWIKVAGWDLPTTVEDFVRLVLGSREEEWVRFKEMPAYKGMPPDLARGVDRWFGPANKRAVAARRLTPKP